jgi:hypothetical protein
MEKPKYIRWVGNEFEELKGQTLQLAEQTKDTHIGRVDMGDYWNCSGNIFTGNLADYPDSWIEEVGVTLWST